jgi:pyruvate/2-oxoglutarate dehydrogenase complex dihydrolipoamide dehydrogenase (E3) component
VVVGAAATGCQLASIFASFGSQTTLLELAPRLLPAEDSAISSEITDVFRSRGIGIATGIGGVRRLERTRTNLHLHYDTPAGPSILETEAVILATGWTGNLVELTLEEAGVKTDRGYVTVNDYLQTSALHIWAAGDITGRMMLVQSANYEARVAAENAVLGPARRYEHRIVPHDGFTDPEYGSVGLTEEQAQVQEPDCLVTRIPWIGPLLTIDRLDSAS